MTAFQIAKELRLSQILIDSSASEFLSEELFEENPLKKLELKKLERKKLYAKY